MTDAKLDDLIAAWLDGRISDSDSQLLQRHLRESADARARFRSLSNLDAALRAVADGGSSSDFDMSLESQSGLAQPKNTIRDNLKPSSIAKLALAASLLLMVGGIAYYIGKNRAPQVAIQSEAASNLQNASIEKTIAGYAALRRVAGIEWREDSSSFREGDVLPAGVFEFENGIAEIDFFCGATVVVEGPAKLDLESDWAVRLHAGRLRANVPPAARGFIIKAADSEIVDLGTEFALEVGTDNVRVEVVDGEVELRGGKHDGEHLVTGEGRSLVGSVVRQDTFKDLSTINDVHRRHEAGQLARLAQWKTSSRQLRTDDRLIAYYPIAELPAGRFVPNKARTGSDRDGTMVGLVNRSSGRFGANSTALEFDRTGVASSNVDRRRFSTIHFCLLGQDR